MPTERLEEKRVEEHVGERERKREREREAERERVQGFGSSFYMFFLHLGLHYANWA